MDTSFYQATKLALVSTIGLSKDALHVYVGLGVFLVAMFISRKPLNSIFPVAVVLFAALTGEALDMSDDIASVGYLRWKASLADIINTLFWPLVIWLLACWRVLWVRGKPI